MTAQDVNSISPHAGKQVESIAVALVSKYVPEGIGGIENHLDMLLRHVQTNDCSYAFIGGSGGEAQGGRVRGYVNFVQRLVRSRAALFHFHGFDRLQLLALMIIARRRIPLVITPHNGVAAIVNEQNSVRRTAKRWADGIIIPALIWQRARIIALTEEERNYYITRFPRSAPLVEVMPNPIGKQKWASLRPATPAVRLLSISRLDWWKRTQDLISAMALLPPEVECDIAGPDCGAAEALKDQAKLTTRTIRFHGAVRGAEKERLFEDATIVVVPSKAEGLSTVALEALARGIPVVASDCASRGLPADGVYLYPFGSVDGLAQTIEHLLRGENVVAARHAARRASAQLVGFEDYGQALRSLYCSSLAQIRTGGTSRGKDRERWRHRASSGRG